MRNFWWLEVTKKVKKYIKGYDTCQRNKNCTEAPIGKLMPNIVPEKPQSHITVDFITKLLLAQEYDSILVVYDKITKMIYFVLTTKKLQQREQQDYPKIMSRSYMTCQKVLSQTGEHSSQ